MANFEKREEIRGRVDEFVNDPGTAEKLKPYYKMFCKRPTFNDDYLPTFNRDNVELIDTDGKGVERITENGLVVDGVEYAVDCIIYSTGFEVGTSYTRRAGYDVTGKGCLDMARRGICASTRGCSVPDCRVNLIDNIFGASTNHISLDQHRLIGTAVNAVS